MRILEEYAPRGQIARGNGGAGMCTNAGFHSDKAWWHIRKSGFNLRTRPFLPQNNRAPLVEANDVEEILTDINADHGDLSRSWRSDQIVCWTWACSLKCAPSPALLAGGAGTRPDHPISGHQWPHVRHPQCASL